MDGDRGIYDVTTPRSGESREKEEGPIVPGSAQSETAGEVKLRQKAGPGAGIGSPSGDAGGDTRALLQVNVPARRGSVNGLRRVVAESHRVFFRLDSAQVDRLSPPGLLVTRIMGERMANGTFRHRMMNQNGAYERRLARPGIEPAEGW